ncbi:hypothetical protein H0O03_03745 [Candidatus Micrarchaeota archaeon]|nr:hypothetical protein [Candidatus Micrarchaeota archaeon]
MAEAPVGKKSFYAMLEDKWYAFADWVVQKLHIPLDKYFVNPLEDHGIPSFPVAVVIAIALIGGIAFLALGGIAPSAVTLSVSVTAAGEPVDGAQVSLAYGTEKLEAETVNGIAEFANVPTGQQVTLTIDKTGYTKVTKRLKPSATPVAIRLELKVASEEEKAKAFLKTQGYTDEQLKSMPADEAMRLASRLGYAAAGGPMITMYVQLEEPLGDPVSDASIVYEAGSVSDAATTDSDGKAMINVPDGASVTAAASKDGYETKSARFTASADATQKITLRKQTILPYAGGNDVPSPNTAPVRFSSVKVRIRGTDPATNESLDVPNATVTLFREDNEAINTTNGSSSADVVINAQAGDKVYASVEATGFARGKSVTKTVEADKATLLPVFLDKATPYHNPDGSVNPDGNVDPITVTVKTQTGRPVSGAKVFLLDALAGTQWGNQTTPSNGSVTFSDIPLETRVIAIAMQPNFVTNVSGELEIGADLNATLTLTASTDNNSAKIDVTALDFYDKPVKDAYVTVTLDGFLPLPNGVLTDARGKALLADLPLGKSANVSGVKGIFEDKTQGTQGPMTAKRYNLTLVLLPPQVTVTFKAVDYFTGESLTANNPLFSVYVGDTATTALASCQQASSSGCSPEKAVFSSIQYALRVTANGYIPTTSTFNPEAGTTPVIEVKLTPSGWTQLVTPPENVAATPFGTSSAELTRGRKISFAPAETEIERERYLGSDPTGAARYVTGTPALQVGQAYYLTFQLYMPENATEAGIYVQAGDKTSVLADDAGILRSFDWNANETIFAEARGAVTSTRGFTTTSCGASESSNGLYKGVYFKIENNGNNYGTVNIVVPFFVTSKARNQINFTYSAYAVLPDGVIRAPLDPALGSNPNQRGKWCKAAMHSIVYNVSDEQVSHTSFHCGLQGCVQVSYEQPGGAPAGGNGYAAVVSLDQQSNVSINYAVTDFNLANPDTPTQLKLTITPEKMTLDRYDPETRNQFSVNVSSLTPGLNRGTVTLESRTANPIAPGLADVFFDYGDKFPQFQSYLLLYGETHATLGNTYYLSYEANEDVQGGSLVLKIKNGDGELVSPTDSTITGAWSHSSNEADPNTILLFTDPVMPADAVYVRLDYDSLPPDCRDTEIVALPLPNCFEYDSTTQLLRFDASSPNTFGRECPLYNVDPNNVSEFDGAVRFNVFCLGLNAQPYTLKVKKNPAPVAASFGTAANVKSVYYSDFSAMGYSTGCGEYPAPKIYLIANNKQLGELDYPYLSYNGVLHSVVDKITQPGAYVYVVNEGMEQKLLLGSSNVTLGEFNGDLNRQQVREILEKTVFRRADTRTQATAAEAGFPYSAFSTRQIKYSWGSLRMSSTNDPTSPDWVNNYDEVTDCDLTNKRGVFVKSLNPRDNTWHEGQVEWNAIGETAKLTSEQYLQSTEFGSVCGLKLEGANATSTALCGTGYWSCGGGCVLPKPVVFVDGTQVDDVACMTDTLLSKMTEHNVDIDVGIMGTISFTLNEMMTDTTSDEARGEGVEKARMLTPVKDLYFLHTPSCNIWRYWKRGLTKTYNCEWLCYSDIMSFEAYDFVNPFSKTKQTIVTCPKATSGDFDANHCNPDTIAELMAGEGVNEGDYTLLEEPGKTLFEFSSVIPGKNLVFTTESLKVDPHAFVCTCAGAAGGDCSALDVYYSSDTIDCPAAAICDRTSYFDTSRSGGVHVEQNAGGVCDAMIVKNECIFSEGNGEICKTGCGYENQTCCPDRICYNGLSCSNGYCSTLETRCGERRGSTPCENDPRCSLDTASEGKGLRPFVNTTGGVEVCDYDCNGGTFDEIQNRCVD